MNEHITTLGELTDKLIPTSKFPLLKYSFPDFNKVQSTLFTAVSPKTDANIVLGTTTSSGKTVCAEYYMAHTLKNEQKVVYVSPLKSLTQEKYDDWLIKFKGYKICISTGDYGHSEKKAQELNCADIICMTSEMLDSRSRKPKSKGCRWMKAVGLIIIDEAHILGTERGHAVEVGLMRVSQLIPHAKILFLSATLPNINQFAEWLYILNGKQTFILNSDWRPTTLYWNFLQYNSRQRYDDQRKEIMDMAIEVIASKPDQMFLCFVHDKTIGRWFEEELRERGYKAYFHNADLEMPDRLKLEKLFASRNLRILISTSTLAWGRTLPARNVIILGDKRGMTEIDVLDIIQMAGRAGRLGVDPDGTVYFINSSIGLWKYKVEQKRAVQSQLLDPEIMGFHILSEIRLKEIQTREDLHKWFEKTLCKIQFAIQFDTGFIDEVFESLLKYGMIKVNEEEKFELTALGLISVLYYIWPRDAVHLKKWMELITAHGLWKDDHALAILLGGIPSIQLPYVPRDMQMQVQDFMHEVVAKGFPTDGVRDSVYIASTYQALTQGKHDFYLRNIQRDQARYEAVVKMINKFYKVGIGMKDYRIANAIVKYGVNRDCAHLCLIPDIGKARAEKLMAAGILEYSHIKRANEAEIKAAVGVIIGEKILDYMHKLRQKKLQKLQKQQQKDS